MRIELGYDERTVAVLVRDYGVGLAPGESADVSLPLRPDATAVRVLVAGRWADTATG